jgi:two-component system, sensor histidine kinase and response regulator
VNAAIREPLARLLVVDDEVPQMKALCNTLEIEGYATTGYSSPRQALEELQADRYDLLLTDLMMPEMDGIALLAAAREVDPNLLSIVMTGHATIDTAVSAMQSGAIDYIQKPFRLNAVMTVLSRALAMRTLRIENAALERGLRERTQELEVANADLEAFSYSVSHDLRAPVRIVQSSIDMYLGEFGTTVPDSGRDLLRYAADGAKRMGQLIEDLLTFSRFSRQPLVKGPVSIQALVERVVAEQRALDPARQVEVTTGALPECNADASLLEQVVVNLISNAFKFTRGRDPARVEVGCVEENGTATYYVQDNGAGFDMQYAHKLFGVFQRLHSLNEFEGTGVGLSLVKRIVERHGGQIVATGSPGAGAKFAFTLG